ncbi:MAG: hypothetical protein OES47_00355 [Acidobacteriota bacterium]|nr:hypothetical protein [Acidobacteriota bacterium]
MKAREVKKRPIGRALAVATLVILAGGAYAVAGTLDEGGAAPSAKSFNWRNGPIWDDGNAEFCAYEVDWSRYGTLYPGRALLILVKEPWAPDLEVKADRPRSDGFDVLKLNHVRDVPTGIYTYHQMASGFFRRDNFALRKLAVSSTEGCGISTAHVVDEKLETRSYFDGQGENTQDYPDGAHPEDMLAASLRDFISGTLPESVSVLPSLMTGRFPSLDPKVYALSRRDGTRLVPAGEFEVTELRLETGDDWLSYAFDRRAPHPLVEHTAASGTTYRLSKCERIPYWSLNRSGGEDWLPATVR